MPARTSPQKTEIVAFADLHELFEHVHRLIDHVFLSQWRITVRIISFYAS